MDNNTERCRFDTIHGINIKGYKVEIQLRQVCESKNKQNFERGKT